MVFLENIYSTNIVSIDIETVRIKENFSDLDDITKTSWAYKFKSEGITPSEEELSEKWSQSASLYAEFSKICAVSVALLFENRLVVKEFFGENELDILAQLENSLHKIYLKGNYRLVGHNSKFFDYPFLCKRYAVNGLSIPQILDTLHLKPWEQSNLCTNEIWKMGGTGYGGSLLAVCNALNIPISKVDLVGDEVGKEYFEGNYDKIGRYCSYDAVSTFNIIRRLKKESIFKFDEVDYINGNSNTGEDDSYNVLTEIGISRRFTQDLQNKLLSVLKDKDLDKQDIFLLEELLEAAFINNAMIGGDNKVVQELKKENIKKFLKQLS